MLSYSQPFPFSAGTRRFLLSTIVELGAYSVMRDTCLKFVEVRTSAAIASQQRKIRVAGGISVGGMSVIIVIDFGGGEVLSRDHHDEHSQKGMSN